MLIRIDLKRDTSVAYFFKNYASLIWRSMGHEVIIEEQFSKDKPNFIITQDSDLDLAKVREKYNKAQIVLCDPKLNSSSHRSNAKNADFCIVSSLEQAESVYRWNKKVLINYWFRYTGVDERFLRENQTIQEENFDIILGYHGNKIHLDSLHNFFLKPIKNLSKKYRIKLKCIYNIKSLGVWKNNFENYIEVEHVQWNSESYVKDLASIHVGIVPSFNPIAFPVSEKIISQMLTKLRYGRDFNLDLKDYLLRFKFTTNPGRLYEYSLISKPVIAEASLSAAQLIQHENNGLLVLGSSGWQKSIEYLIENPVEISRMGENLNKSIARKYSPLQATKRINNFIGI